MATMPNKTLVVLHGNRYLEVFSDQPQQIKIVNVPDMESIDGELLIEELLELRLPKHWAAVYRDGHLLDRGPIRDLKVADIAVRDFDQRMFKALNRIQRGSQLVTVTA